MTPGQGAADTPEHEATAAQLVEEIAHAVAVFIAEDAGLEPKPAE